MAGPKRRPITGLISVIGKSPEVRAMNKAIKTRSMLGRFAADAREALEPGASQIKELSKLSAEAQDLEIDADMGRDRPKISVNVKTGRSTVVPQNISAEAREAAIKGVAAYKSIPKEKLLKAKIGQLERKAKQTILKGGHMPSRHRLGHSLVGDPESFIYPEEGPTVEKFSSEDKHKLKHYSGKLSKLGKGTLKAFVPYNLISSILEGHNIKKQLDSAVRSKRQRMVLERGGT